MIWIVVILSSAAPSFDTVTAVGLPFLPTGEVPTSIGLGWTTRFGITPVPTNETFSLG